MGQAKTISRFINILIRDNLLGHNSVSAAPICLVLSGFAELPGLLLKNHGLKNKVKNPGKVFQPDTVRELTEDPGATGKGLKNGTFTKRLWELVPRGKERIKVYKEKGKFWIRREEGRNTQKMEVKCWVEFYSLTSGIDVKVCWDQSWIWGTQQSLLPGRGFLHGERSGYFPISLDLEMLKCKLFRTSTTTLIVLDGFHTSLSAWILLVPWMKTVPEQLNQHIQVPDWGKPFGRTASVTPVKALLPLVLTFRFTNNMHGTADDIRWCSSGSMYPATFWTVLRGQMRWKLVIPRWKLHQKWGFAQNIHSFNAFLAFSFPAVLYTPSWPLTSSPSALHWTPPIYFRPSVSNRT